jgi:hypothetical protein
MMHFADYKGTRNWGASVWLSILRHAQYELLYGIETTSWWCMGAT